MQAYASRYDPWHGRYFLSAAIFLAPLAALVVDQPRARRYGQAVAVLGCAAAITAVLFRSNTPIVGTHYGDPRPSIFTLDRIAQLARDQHAFEPVLRAYERTVPAGARVREWIPRESPAYAFFGEGLSRRVVPRRPGEPLADGEWLLFDEAAEPPAAGDIAIGEQLWLRRPPTGPATAEGRSARE